MLAATLYSSAVVQAALFDMFLCAVHRVMPCAIQLWTRLGLALCAKRYYA